MRAKPRTPARRDLSLVDANRGRLITYQEDVLRIKEEIERRWAGLLSCVFDTDTEEWVIIEHCQDGTDRLCFCTPTLSQSTIEKIQRADQATTGFVDPNKVYEEEDRKEQREKDRSFSEAIGEAGERLYFALRRDGVIHRPSVFFPNR